MLSGAIGFLFFRRFVAFATSSFKIDGSDFVISLTALIGDQLASFCCLPA